MPPPSYCSKNSTRSARDHESDVENDCDFNNPKNVSSSESSSDENSQVKCRNESVGIVKSLLGPSFEDAVLRTLEFGKSLIQKSEENEQWSKEKKSQKDSKKKKWQSKRVENSFSDEESKNQDGEGDFKKVPEGRPTRKRIVFTAKLDKEIGKPFTGKKHKNVFKIRSLDSDLKQVAPSPEKIKRQLEALIQINKDVPPEHTYPWNFLPQSPKFPVEVTVMPSICTYKKETGFNCSPASDVSPSIRRGFCATECGEPSGKEKSSCDRPPKKKNPCQSGICQAPDFLTNALGPTIDVSIIENIKMMRNLFKNDKQDPCSASSLQSQCPSSCATRSNICDSSAVDEEKKLIQKEIQFIKEEEKFVEEELKFLQERSEDGSCKSRRAEATARKVEELLKKVEELELRQQQLINLTDELEKIREQKQHLCDEEEAHRRQKVEECKDMEAKFECLRQRIECEEEKLSRLKDQYECYKRELMEAKLKKEALKRNKSVLDAWDVIASRVCHTKLPSFSRAYCLEKKNPKGPEASENLHCCFLPQDTNIGDSDKKCASRNQIDTYRAKSGESCLSMRSCKLKVECPFPIQRDIICGLHQLLKVCKCSETTKHEGITCSSDDELLKKCGVMRKESKHPCRSRSETAMKRDTCAKIVKVMWAVTRINIFQDNCRTYEVMDATTKPPNCVPAKTEGIFVVKNPQRRACSSKKKCTSSNWAI